MSLCPSLRSGLFPLLFLGTTPVSGWAADYYVAPQGHIVSCAANGSQTCPWSSVGAALSSGKLSGGDVVYLMAGAHGQVTFGSDASFPDLVTFRSEPGARAHLSKVLFRDGASNIRLQDVDVWLPESSPALALVYAYSNTSRIQLAGLEVRSRADGDRYANWSLERWRAVRGDGITLLGQNNLVEDTKVTGVSHGIIVGTQSVARKNIVDGYAGDGMRAFGDSIVTGNVITNAFQVSDNHADGFQSFAGSSGSVKNLIVSNNTILEWTLPETHPLRAKLQGIGMFDGFYDGLVVENNVVATSDYHGIAIYGARQARIVNNTVVNIDGLEVAHPWIIVREHKNGTPSQDVVVSNNLAMRINGTSDPARNVVFENNRTILDPMSVFEDLGGFNFRPKPSSGFLDVANVTYAPASDVLGHARPSGAGPDLGAYEVGATDGTTPAGTAEPVTEPTPTTETTTVTTEPAPTTDTSSGTTTDPVPTTDTTVPADSGTTDTSSGTDTTTSTDGSTTTTETTSWSTWTKPGRSAGKWSKARK